MQDVRIDDKGALRCWNCGATTFKRKRTRRSKAAMTVFLASPLLTHKKLKCEGCGVYNQTGNPKPFDATQLGKLYHRPRPERTPRSPRAALRQSLRDPDFRRRMAEAAQRAKATRTAETVAEMQAAEARRIGGER